ncbi:hypothetical protein [Endozoicomonas sp. SCSIO W0465]|uniref:hypothetical protein n=1 Tax=Endozoicomonas sp. SCSIO W0465 TaxID=2918516 RepID=UPI002074E5E6|nr:hypothetical protein [Endozoicomonas sp. SCSIO W0465]USE39472.1 hypothetical protein MJO57_15700 [Endozoicomonas sp. SCSIO W0465]
MSDYRFSYFRSFLFTCLLLIIFMLCNASLVYSFHEDQVLILSPEMNQDLEITNPDLQEVTITLDTKALEKDLQGRIPVQLILDNDRLTFENGEQQILWNNQINILEHGQINTANNDSFIYIKLSPDPGHLDKNVKITIRKEKDLSRLSAMAAFFPQILPIILMDEVKFGPKPVIFYEALMRWNYRILGGDITKSIRNLVLSQTFGDQKTLAAQCSADFIEGFLLFESANYGENASSTKTKIQTFRTYVMGAPFKRLMDCMSTVLSSTLSEIQESQIGDEWYYLKNMNKVSINGLSKIMVGYGFNTFAFEAGDFFKLVKKNIGFSNATNDLALQTELDRSIIKAVQYTLQSGYEEFFKGQLQYHHFNERYALPLATGAGIIEILLRLYGQQGMAGRDQTHQVNSLTKRAEAISVSINKALPLSELSDHQLLMLGVTIPAVLYGTFKIANVAAGYDVSSPVFKLFDSAYEGMVLGAATQLISPVLQRYGILAAHAIQKPILQYMNAEPGGWSEFFLADTIRYRIDVLTED